MNHDQGIMMLIATQKGYISLQKLVDNNYVDFIGCVVTYEEENVEESYHDRIKDICIKNNINFYLWEDIKKSFIDMVKQHHFLGGVAISWRYYIPLEINDYLINDLIIIHDSLLPKYRGFAPTPTAIICGEEVIGITAIFASDNIDEGDIIFQEKMAVNKEMYIKEIIDEQSKMYGDITLRLLLILSSGGSLPRIPQNNEDATYSIWRNPDDCEIDWRKSSEQIYNFVRAISSPYPGAFTYIDDNKIIIDKVRVIDDKLFPLRDCGKIWKINNNMPEVICGKGMIIIERAHYEDGKCVVWKRVRCRLGKKS